ncbi:IS1595 family transposase [Heyndrickxia oleronia]|uniref:IS1595 family transposase n=1 Tax=Heyndrickxia oleronia TaxID=38875 RepID=UPI001AE08DED|nr:IS1595 family transposase [Heyndrickxia oleronia]MEC1377231.1 IS1595 family transposase [Heyndrickxia oleronia]QQZ07413.1 IS1595 family transposase [Heyndrickxia oleronia]
MKATDILKAIQKLNPAEKHRLREYLIDALTASSSTRTVLEEISERKNKDGYRCPNCESEHIVRFGKYSTIVDGEEVKKQRYRCKACRMTFTDFTNTALYRTRHLNRWMKFIECMIEGYSLRKSAELIGDITHVTLFYWRHKLLTALKQMEITNFQGIVEMDETYFLYSEKGQRKIKDRKPRKRGGSAKKRGISKEQVCVLVARDRDKVTFSETLGMGRLTKEQLDKAIGHKLSNRNVLCTDAWRAFKTYATEKDISIYQFKSDGKIRTKGLYHIQNVNNYHRRLKGWIQRFNGVATEYLNNYLAWFQVLESINHQRNEVTMNDMIIKGNLIPNIETYDTLRLSRFTV